MCYGISWARPFYQCDNVVCCRVPSCPKCDTGILKPYVVFFGDNVPKPRVEFVRRQVEQSDALLVVGSSLYVFSGYRLKIFDSS